MGMIWKAAAAAYTVGGVFTHRRFRYDRTLAARVERFAMTALTVCTWPAIILGAILAGPPELEDFDEEWARPDEDPEWR